MKTNDSHATSKPKSAQFWFLFLLATSFVTLLVHGYLSVHGYNLTLGLEAGQSLCNVSAAFNCDNAAVSRYANLFGIPMALLGLLTQLALIVFLFSSHWGLSQYSELLRRLTFWLALFVATVSIIMANISIFALGSYCPFCIVTYVLSFISVFATVKFQSENPISHFFSDLSLLFSSVRWPLVILLAIPALGYISNAIVLDSYGFGKLDLIVQDSLIQWEHSPKNEF